MYCFNKLWLILALTICGCSRIGGYVGASSTISGKWLDMSQSQSLHKTDSSVSTMSCTSAVVKLYRLSASGAKITPELASAVINDDGSYNLSLSGLDVSVSADSADPLLLEIAGCSDTRSRIVTGTKEQDLSPGSSLISWIQQTPYSSRLTEANRSSLKNLLQVLESQESYADAYALLTSDSNSTQIFQELFSTSPNVLLDAAPVLVSSSVPATAHEGSSISLSATSTHWSPSYDQFYLWKIGSTIINSGIDVNSISFTPSANMQGARTITLYIGQDDGTGHLNQSKSFVSQIFNINISDDFPTQAPALSIVGSDHINTSSTTLSMATGAGSVNCATFTKLALTADSLIAPLLASDYTLTCATAGTQTIPVTLSAEGATTFRLWAMDSSGNVSATPSAVTVYYSTSAPAISITSPAGSSYQKGSFTLAGACDASSGTVSVSGDASAPSSFTCQSGGTFGGTVTLTAGEGSKSLSFSQTNAYGNTGTITLGVVRDDTSPSITISSPAGGAVGATAITITGTCETGSGSANALIFSGDIAGSPVTRSSACQSNGTFSESLTLTTGDGTKTLTAKQNDEAGNTGTTSATAVLDQTGPSITLVSSPSTARKGGDSYTVQFKVTEPHITTSQNFSVEYSLDNGSTWTSAATVSTSAGPLSNAAMSTSITWPSSTSTQARLRVSGSDQFSNPGTSSSSSAFAIDSTAPTISSFVVASGATSVAMPTVTIALSASDVGSSVARMQINETGTIDDSKWVTYLTSSTFTMSQTNGAKTLYVWVQDTAGNVSSVSSRTLSLDFGSPPVVSLTSPSPTPGVSYSGSVSLQWSCSSSNPLAAQPISLYYSTDDGVTFSSIASSLTNNLTATTGSYSWSIPGGTTRFRVLVTCTSEAGVVSQVMSGMFNTSTWKVWAGDVGLPTEGVNAYNALLTPGVATQRYPIVLDKYNNVYIFYNHKIRKIDSLTGQVSVWAGNGAGCSSTTIDTGATLSTSSAWDAMFIGSSTDGQYIYTTLCSTPAIFKINVDTMAVTKIIDIPSMPGGQNYTYLTSSKILLVIGTNRVLYKVGLEDSTPVLTEIYGNSSSSTCATLPIGTPALGQPIPWANGNCGGSNAEPTLLSNADASKIWVGIWSNTSKPHYIIENVSGVYQINSAPLTTMQEHQICVNYQGSTTKSLCAYRWASATYKIVDISNLSISTFTVSAQDANALGTLTNSPTNQTYIFTSLDGLWLENGASSVHLAGLKAKDVGLNQPDPSQLTLITPNGITYDKANQKIYIVTTSDTKVIDANLTANITRTTSNTPNAFPMRVDTSGTRSIFFQQNVGLGIGQISPILTGASIQLVPQAGTTAGPFTSGQSVTATKVTSSSTRRLLAHSDGSVFYFDSVANNYIIYKVSGSKYYPIAGLTSTTPGYRGTDTGNLAASALLTNVWTIQEIPAGHTNAGDLLIFDGTWLRRISYVSEAPNPKIYDVVNLGSGGYSMTGLQDVVYDFDSESSSVLGSGKIYYYNGSVKRLQYNSTLTTPTSYTYPFEGTSFSGNVQLEATPLGLLVLQPNKARVLRADL